MSLLGGVLNGVGGALGDVGGAVSNLGNALGGGSGKSPKPTTSSHEPAPSSKPTSTKNDPSPQPSTPSQPQPTASSSPSEPSLPQPSSPSEPGSGSGGGGAGTGNGDGSGSGSDPTPPGANPTSPAPPNGSGDGSAPVDPGSSESAPVAPGATVPSDPASGAAPNPASPAAAATSSPIDLHGQLPGASAVGSVGDGSTNNNGVPVPSAGVGSPTSGIDDPNGVSNGDGASPSGSLSSGSTSGGGLSHTAVSAIIAIVVIAVLALIFIIWRRSVAARRRRKRDAMVSVIWREKKPSTEEVNRDSGWHFTNADVESSPNSRAQSLNSEELFYNYTPSLSRALAVPLPPSSAGHSMTSVVPELPLPSPLSPPYPGRESPFSDFLGRDPFATIQMFPEPPRSVPDSPHHTPRASVVTTTSTIGKAI